MLHPVHPPEHILPGLARRCLENARLSFPVRLGLHMLITNMHALLEQ